MFPAVPVPSGLGLRPAIDIKLKPGWRVDPGKRGFVSASGERCAPSPRLPKGSRILPKVPALAKTPLAKLSAPERELLGYAQIVLPEGEKPEDHLAVVRAWPCVAEATMPPAVSLPNPVSGKSKS